ncbi:hypothetical protein PILCRDRAFT_247709 [Piloderma croceum F 1598]|uniref:RTA1 like protein n=1 Tax=Piloderma croceum (strain F 1598) TaxID=765440 RepID=A0A0C3CEH5_PILCF|nr:hypothetical protein PILCRDRAFT_247709 [Piloderma croceum F 1598]
MVEIAPTISVFRRLRQHSQYNYVPIEYVCAIFVALYGLSTLIHIGQAFRYRMRWLLPTAALAGVAEVLGWSARLWSSQNASLHTPFIMQISCTIIAPTPLVAANFVILGMIIEKIGDHYSRLTTKQYIMTFCSFDVISLIVQAIGGGKASVAKTLQGANHGAHIMLGGIVFQLVSLIIYALCATEFLLRFAKDKPIRKAPIKRRRAIMDTRMKIMIYALIFSTTCIFIRSVYRTVELSDGWNGRIISTQVYFNVLDGAMVTLAIYTLNFAHPGVLLPDSNDLLVDSKLESSFA